MSLKAFHIVFIVVATMLTGGFGVWAVREYARGQAPASILALGIGSFVLGGVLVWYAKYFLRKLKDIGYL
jgi:hypothetical protein